MQSPHITGLGHSIRLAEMEKLGLVKRKGKEVRGKIISVYRITEYGKKVLEIAQKLVL